MTTMALIPPVTAIDATQWQPHEYPLIGHFAHFAQLAGAVVTDGPLAGWFDRPMTRMYSYAPFNARAVENYQSLAFFAGYDAPWNFYRRNPEVLRRLELVLRYVFALQDANGALPEYAPAHADTPMLAPTSFGAEYMASTLAVAGDLLPTGLRDDLVQAATRATTYVLTAAESWEHARSYSNQFLGAMVAGARLAQLTGNADLLRLVERGMDGTMREFLAAPGYLYEADGPETFGYWFVTLPRLNALAAYWPDSRITEVVRRHCAWMGRWMLPEPDGTTVTLADGHQTRTPARGEHGRQGVVTLDSGRERDGILAATFALRFPRTAHGVGAFLAGADDERRWLRLFFADSDAMTGFQRAWEATPDLLAACDWRLARGQYSPVSTLTDLPIYAPAPAAHRDAFAALPMHDATPRHEEVRDANGNAYTFVRHPRYATAFAFGEKRGRPRFGPQFLWLDGAGTLALVRYQTRAWETAFADGSGTGKTPPASVTTRREGGDTEIIAAYPDLGFTKAYVLREDEIRVRLSSAAPGGRAPQERIPLLLHETDVLRVDYGSCAVSEFYESNSGGFGVVSRIVTVERDGRTLAAFDFGAPVDAVIRRHGSYGGRVELELIFAFAPIYYRRLGYCVLIGR